MENKKTAIITSPAFSIVVRPMIAPIKTYLTLLPSAPIVLAMVSNSFCTRTFKMQ
jgi:hypothetical protein